MKKRLIFVLFLVLLILISGCGGKKDVQKALEEIRTGTEGIVMSFLPNSPPDKIHVEASENTFDVALEIRNKGAYPQPSDIHYQQKFGDVYLSGFDPNIMKFEKKSGSQDLNGKTLEGKSTINPSGGLDVLTFGGVVYIDKLNVEKYEPTLLVTACYYYETIAGPSVCIDPNPYSTVKEKKVCEVQDVSLTNQGAPIAVTNINEEALAGRTQFKITIKNVGGGDIIKELQRNKCYPFGEKLTREEVDKVMVEWVKIANKPLTCGPFAEEPTKGEKGIIRLINGEGFIICNLQKSEYKNANTAYTTPIAIRLSYAYRNTVEKKIQIKKESSEVTSPTSASPDTFTIPPPPIDT